MNDIHAAETKALGRFDLPHAFDDFMRAFEAFKEANDERLGEIEKRMSADAVTAERVERIGDSTASRRPISASVSSGTR